MCHFLGIKSVSIVNPTGWKDKKSASRYNMGPLRLLDGISEVLTPRMKKVTVKYTATSSTVDSMLIG